MCCILVQILSYILFEIYNIDTILEYIFTALNIFDEKPIWMTNRKCLPPKSHSGACVTIHFGTPWGQKHSRMQLDTHLASPINFYFHSLIHVEL